ncbi:MAG TPA: TonB-dependent receptor plug domain-containing protein, partial [Candidatus Solibacter sp.]|nr:TonB-dependent receptor plug domain-containing protein [Candidatus Solibacter sp.]
MTVSRERSLHGNPPKEGSRVDPDRGFGRRLARLGFPLAFSLSAIAVGAAQAQSQADLSRLDVEDLMNVKVTSVSKREQSLSRTAAAVFVINQEDIRRSGAINIPDLLRMAPGVDVEQIDANAWAISIRGFNSRYSNKVLVLIDGRTVYTPSFSGVFWEHLDMPLENIERIEVIRGPGATVWGANAVNGVISIFTKSSKDTKGGLVTAGGGSQTHALGLVQYGGTAGKDGAYRAF